MKDQDGRPVVRDPIFLAETQIMPKADADRLLHQVGLRVTPIGLRVMI